MMAPADPGDQLDTTILVRAQSKDNSMNILYVNTFVWAEMYTACLLVYELWFSIIVCMYSI